MIGDVFVPTGNVCVITGYVNKTIGTVKVRTCNVDESTGYVNVANGTVRSSPVGMKF